MKHTILHTAETGGPGGAESVLLALATRIDASRFRSLALLPYKGWLHGKLQENGIPVFLAKSSAWYDPALPKAMARLVRQEEVQLIHSHLPDQNFYACLVGRATGTRTVVTYHGLATSPETDKLRSAIKRWWVRHSADAVVAVSDHLKQALTDLQFPRDRIFRIHNGVDVERFELPETHSLRAELGYCNGTKLVGMVANLREGKGYEYFIEAAARVAKANPQVRFLAVGEIDETIRTEMQRLIHQTSLGDRFLFTGFRQDVPAILNDLDIFVLSSVSEGFSLATVEAMAAGKPVIATRSGGPEEIIDHGRDGILIPPADAEALAREICSLLEHPDRARELAEAGHRKATTAFSMQRMIADYERLYERLLDGA